MTITMIAPSRRQPGQGVDVQEHARAGAGRASCFAAHAAGCALAVFGIAERVGDGFHITQLCAHGGRVVGHYRKRHLGEGEDFPGLAALVTPAGEVAARLPDWRPGSLIVDIPSGEVSASGDTAR